MSLRKRSSFGHFGVARASYNIGKLHTTKAVQCVFIIVLSPCSSNIVRRSPHLEVLYCAVTNKRGRLGPLHLTPPRVKYYDPHSSYDYVHAVRCILSTTHGPSDVAPVQRCPREVGRGNLNGDFDLELERRLFKRNRTGSLFFLEQCLLALLTWPLNLYKFIRGLHVWFRHASPQLPLYSTTPT